MESNLGPRKQAGIAISMDGKGRFLDNIFIGRLWRSLKYELICLVEFVAVSALGRDLANWFTFYNEERFHQGLSYKTPEEIYQMAMAA